jgi:hypothetical protein
MGRAKTLFLQPKNEKKKLCECDFLSVQDMVGLFPSCFYHKNVG